MGGCLLCFRYRLVLLASLVEPALVIFLLLQLVLVVGPLFLTFMVKVSLPPTVPAQKHTQQMAGTAAFRLMY